MHAAYFFHDEVLSQWNLPLLPVPQDLDERRYRCWTDLLIGSECRAQTYPWIRIYTGTSGTRIVLIWIRVKSSGSKKLPVLIRLSIPFRHIYCHWNGKLDNQRYQYLCLFEGNPCNELQLETSTRVFLLKPSQDVELRCGTVCLKKSLSNIPVPVPFSKHSSPFSWKAGIRSAWVKKNDEN
jgi:hypothetical protein